MWSIVLISQSPSLELADSLPGDEEHISVFLPCAPNPTTGFFFYVPKSKIIEIEMSTEDAATLIMSAGVVQPGLRAAEDASPRSPAWPTPHGSPTRPRCNRCRRRWSEFSIVIPGRVEDANPEYYCNSGFETRFARPAMRASPRADQRQGLVALDTDKADSAAPRRARLSASDCPS